MKYQSLVSSTTPSDLQEWLGQELEDRGIDSVYARSILSLLQQDCVDIEPKECQHFQNKQLKVLHKYGGPEILYSSPKSKHQKWMTWGKRCILSSSCCPTVISDLEVVKKQTAVDCLRTASDYVCHIEELVDEVWIKLKNIKNLKGEKEEIHLRNVNDSKVIDSFFIPPSSPTDEIKKYFAAFPSLNDKFETETNIHQINIKNAWRGACILKENPKIHTFNKSNQPIIPYSPLKKIKAIYTNEKNCIDTTFGNRKINWTEQIVLTKQVLSSVKGSWKEIYSLLTKPIALSLEHLVIIQININFLHEENNFISDCGLKISIEEPNYFIKTLCESNFAISNIDKSSNRNGAKNVFSNLINFKKEIFNNYFDCADFKDSEMSVHIVESKLSDSNDDQSSFQPNTSEISISFVQNTSNLCEQPTYLEYLSFEKNFETDNEYNRNFLPSNSLVASNEMLYPANVVSDSHSVVKILRSENSAFDLVKKDSNYLYEESLSIGEKDGFKRNNIIEAQHLLKKVLFIKKVFMTPQSKASTSSTSFEQIASLTPISNETMSQAVVSSNKHISYVQHCNNTVQASSTAHLPQKSIIQFNEMWFLFWGVDHNHISLTWQKDFIPFGSTQNQKLPNVSESFLALSNEITEDGVQLLKAIDYILSNNEDPIMYYNMVSIHDQNNSHTDLNYNSQAGSDEDPLVSQYIIDSQNFADSNDANICSPVNDISFTSISIESDSPKILHTQVFQNSLFNFENNYMKATDNTEISALPTSYESVNPIETDCYIEGGGWSFGDSCLDYADPYERPGSLDDLELNSEYSQFVYQKRARCTSETDDIKLIIKMQNENQIQKKRFRQKFPEHNRPCLFFLQGNCRRFDCKYSHDFSTTTCRFWNEGSCFKGDTCPFLHGYIKEKDNDFSKLEQRMSKGEEKASAYSLESEADFPSLSSPKPEHSISDSSIINFSHVKGKKE